jgi:hypothetical protein
VNGLYVSHYVPNDVVTASDYTDRNGPNYVEMVNVPGSPELLELRVATFEAERFPELFECWNRRERVEEVMAALRREEQAGAD